MASLGIHRLKVTFTEKNSAVNRLINVMGELIRKQFEMELAIQNRQNYPRLLFLYSAPCCTPPSLQLQSHLVSHGQTFHPPMPVCWRFGGLPS